ncbi:hypothetical protein [Catalinimonas alkaloidigena]|nr:hypothetical protein [Catalinimonas alkaloidigena]
MPFRQLKLHPLEAGVSAVRIEYEAGQGRKSWQWGMAYVHHVQREGEGFAWVERAPAQGVTFRLARRWYNAKSEAPRGSYFSPLLFYRLATTSKTESNLDAEGHYVEEKKHIHYQVLGLQALFGHQARWGQHVTFDVYGGVGARLKYGWVPPQQTDPLYYPTTELLGKTLVSNEQNALLWTPSLQLGVALGYLF